MHAVIVGLSDETYDHLVALCTQGLDHSWLATKLLEDAIHQSPQPGVCRECGEPFFVESSHRGHPYAYCSDACRKKGYQARKLRWWRKKGKAWRAQHRPNVKRKRR
jgi:hypothetical protein